MQIDFVRTTMSDVASSFTFNNEKEDRHLEAFKWQRGPSKYEVYMETLETMDICKMMRHGKEFKAKALRQVSAMNHQGPSLHEVFGRTLSLALGAVWQAINDDADANPAVNNAKTIAKDNMHPKISCKEGP